VPAPKGNKASKAHQDHKGKLDPLVLKDPKVRKVRKALLAQPQ
jgi:hypothetical protein